MFTVLVPADLGVDRHRVPTYAEALEIAKKQGGQIYWDGYAMHDLELFAEVCDSGAFEGSYDEWVEMPEYRRDWVLDDYDECEDDGDEP